MPPEHLPTMSIQSAIDTVDAFDQYANNYASPAGRAALRLAGVCADIIQQDTRDQVAWDGDNFHEEASGARVRYVLDTVSEVAPKAHPDRGEAIDTLGAFVDGDMVAIVTTPFVNLQESDVIAWIPVLSHATS